MQLIGNWLGTIFGLLMLILSVAVAVETLVRKIFTVSLGGVDELSGYAIAVGAPLAFTVTLIERRHIRINLLHIRLPETWQAILNGLASIMLGMLAVYMLVYSVRTFLETREYNSIAQTIWATPLIYPQFLWVIAMGVFAACAGILALRSFNLMCKRNWQEINLEFHPPSLKEELDRELDDLKRR